MLCHAELASTMRDEERNYTIAARCDREALQPLSTKHSISVSVPVSLQPVLYRDTLETTKGAKTDSHLQTERLMLLLVFFNPTLFFFFYPEILIVDWLHLLATLATSVDNTRPCQVIFNRFRV